MSTQGAEQSNSKESKLTSVESVEKEIVTLEGELSDKPGALQKIGRALKYPFVVVSSLVASAGGASVAASVAASSALTVPVVGWATVAGIITGMALVKRISLFEISWYKGKIKEIDEKCLKLLNEKIAIIKAEKSGSNIDLIFNWESSLNQEGKTEVKPIKITKELCNALISAFDKESSTEIKLKTIDISDADLDDAQFHELLTAGIGKFSTTHLSLRNNKLTNAAIDYLHRKVVKKMDSFADLKSLDLSGNKLTGECLPKIYEIAARLELEELNLSNNDLASPNTGVENQSQLDKFLNVSVSLLISLKKLVLRKVGLTDKHKHALRSLFIVENNVESLDLRENPGLTYPFLKEHLDEKGIALNISLKEIKTDIDAKVKFSKTMKEHEEAFDKMGCGASTNQSRLIFLLKQLIKKALPGSMKSKLQATNAYRRLSAVAESVNQQEAGEKIDQVLLNTLKEKFLTYYGAYYGNQNPKAQPVLNQFDQNKSFEGICELKLLHTTKDGIKAYWQSNCIIICNTKTRKKFKINHADLVIKLQELAAEQEQKDHLVLCGEDDQGKALACKIQDKKLIFIKRGIINDETIGEHIVNPPDAPVSIFLSDWVKSLEELIPAPPAPSADAVPTQPESGPKI